MRTSSSAGQAGQPGVAYATPGSAARLGVLVDHRRGGDSGCVAAQRLGRAGDAGHRHERLVGVDEVAGRVVQQHLVVLVSVGRHPQPARAVGGERPGAEDVRADRRLAPAVPVEVQHIK